jgi:hypothetical protein
MPAIDGPELTSDGGLSSLGTSARQRRQGAGWTHTLAAWIDGWTCLQCRKVLSPRDTGRYFYCSDACRDKSLAAERKKRGY